MIDATLSNSLLSSLYGASTNNAEWERFCQRFFAQTDCPVTMFGHAMDTGKSLGIVGGGWDEAWLQSYYDYYGFLNPWMRLNLAMRPGMIGVSDLAMPRDELFKTEYYNDWLRPQDNIVAGAAVLTHRSERCFMALGAACRAQHADEDLSQLSGLLEALAPHIMRVVDMSSTLSSGDRVSATHLESSRCAVFLVHRSGRVGYRNAAATQILRKPGVLSIRHDERLSAADDHVRSHIGNCISAMNAQAFESLPEPLAIPLADDAVGMLHAHIFPDGGGQIFPESIWSDPVNGAFVVAGSTGLGEDFSVRQVVMALGCSPAEARLAEALVEGSTLSEYAGRTKLRRHTVRNQMQALLRKTSTHSQVEFLNLVARLTSPFADGQA